MRGKRADVNPDFNRLLTEPAGDRLDVFLATARRLGTKFDDRLPVRRFL
jgi:hypothetical protein